MVPNCLIHFTILFYMDIFQKSIYTFLMSTIYLSEMAHPLLIEYFKSKGYHIHIIENTDITYEPVSSHPDIYMCSLGLNKPIFFGCPEKIGKKYPHNIIYNAACTGKFFIHNLKYTDQQLLKAADGMVKINVSQGYSKCNILIVNETSIITSDAGIYNACRDQLDVLLISPGHIKLKNFDYGFIGGASGRIEDTIVFNGNLEKHPDYMKITDFITNRGLNILYFKEYQLEDIGSIIL